MTTPILICDDSSMARKQMARALPQDWDVRISFATNGVEGVEAIRAGRGEILFLDLNMPEMDGYQVLDAIRTHDLATLVIVVSGDIQPEAHQRVMGLGALAFIKKPVDPEQLGGILRDYGILSETGGKRASVEVKVDLLDAYREIANVAMGRAGDLLARLLGAFVVLPIPSVNMIEISDLRMALKQVADDDTLSGVCQGFIGAGIAGEALLMFNESSFADMAELMKYKGEIDDAAQLELLMDVASILLGACLTGIADQLDITFSQGHPKVLGRHVKVADLLKSETSQWQKTLAIEIAYRIENKQINCDLLLLFTEDSLPSLNERLHYIVD
jgi:chemotaxis protein CheY-P-specific phosphatase CheC/ActR/RegA family two-component response regulator